MTTTAEPPSRVPSGTAVADPIELAPESARTPATRRAMLGLGLGNTAGK